MSGEKWINRPYTRRRKKESLAQLVVRFLIAYNEFNRVYRVFNKYEGLGNDFTESGLSHRMDKLCDIIFIDLKKKSDFLYRNLGDENNRYSEIPIKYDDLKKMLTISEDDKIEKNKTKFLFIELNRALLNQSIDCNINRIFRKLIVLKENLYELEFYKVQYAQEHLYINKTVSLLKEFDYVFDENETEELNQIYELDRLSQKILGDTKIHARLVLKSCNSLFKETSEILLYIIQDSGSNEVLALNLLRERDLVENIYGDGALERIFSRIYMQMNIYGNTGLEKAINYLRNNCDNISELSDSY